MRKNEISFLNVLFCLLVIFIHITSAPISELDKESVQYILFFIPWRLSAFVVQGFIFLSGMKMFLKPTGKTDYKKYYLSRFKKIILPYIFAVFAFYLYFVNRGYFPFKVQDLAGYILKGDLVSHFYFVIIIAQFYLLRPLWEIILRKTQAKNKTQIVIFLISLVISVWCAKYLPDFLKKVLNISFAYNDRILSTYLVYWIGGVFAGAGYDAFKCFVKKLDIIYLLYPAAAFLEVYLAYKSFTGNTVAFAENMHFFYCIFAILFCFKMGSKFADYVSQNTLFKWINASSYYIYLVHPIFIFIIDKLMKTYGIISTESTFLIRGLVTYFCSILICTLYLNIKEKIVKKR